MPLHLTCAFEIIIMPNEKVTALFHHCFFLPDFDLSLKLIEKWITPQLQDPLSCAFFKYSQLLFCILVDSEWVYQSITSFLKGHSSNGQDFSPPWPDMLAEIA